MTQTAAKTLSIRSYSISRDMFEAGDCAECAACGRSIRHVTEINGVTYGTRCAEALLASNEEAVIAEAAPAKVETQEITFEMIEAAAISPMRKSIARQDLAEKKLNAAAAIFGSREIVNRQFSKPTWLLEESIKTSAKAEGYALIIEVKNATGRK